MKKILLVLILLLGIFTRLWHLEQIPTFISQDELGYVINAKSLAASGTDITGTWNPWNLTPVTPWLAELPTQLMAPFFLLPLPVTVAARLPFVILSLIVPFALAGISYEFFKSRSAQLWTFTIAMFNPWIWQLGRMSFDPYFSFSFYIFGAYLLIKLSGWRRLFSLIPFFVGFYTYQGHKIVFLPWVLFFMIFALRKSLKKTSNLKLSFSKLLKKSNWPIYAVGILSVFLFSIYIFVQLPTHSSSDRTSTIFTPNHPDIASKVNAERSLSLESPLTSKFVNKYTVWSGTLLKKLSNTYSFKTLFLSGQANNSAFSVWNYGYFHIIDSILIIFGLLLLYKRERYKFLTLFLYGLFAFVLTYLIAEGEAYIFRSSLNIPLLILLAGIGASYIQKSIPNYTKIVLPLLYALSILYFGYLYFARYPVLAAERQYFNEQIVIEYIRRVQLDTPDQKIVIFDPEAANTAWYYTLLSNQFDTMNPNEIQKQINEETFQFGNVKITSGCQPNDPNQFSEIIIAENNIRVCELNELGILGEPSATQNRSFTPPQLQLNAIKDSGIVYRIFNDSICAGSGLGKFIYINQLRQFEFQTMDTIEFCQTWVSRSEN